MTDPSRLEDLLKRERMIVATALALLCGLAWIYLLSGARMGASAWDMTNLALFPHASSVPSPTSAMAGMDMAGMSMAASSSATPARNLGVWLTTVAMWGAMMVAMMTPSAAPTILLYARVHRSAASPDSDNAAPQVAPAWAFAAGYLLMWLTFSVAAAGLQWALQGGGLLSAQAMASHSKALSAAVLIGAGVYQFTPVQNLCLRHCRAPAAFLSRHWRPGVRGAVRLGIAHGAYCVGCCWILMALLFVGGVMNLAWIAALTLLVLAQKLVRGGVWVSRVSGALLIVWGLATLAV